MNLDFHGSASRCLLRLRENEGEPVVSDEAFLVKYRDRFPGWAERPGALGGAALLTLAAEFNLATELERTRDYDQLVAEHAAGRSILVLTEHAPLPGGVGRRPHLTTSLLLDIDPTGFSLWWPDPRGLGETLPRTDRIWWSRWSAVGIVLHRTAVVAGGEAAS